MIVKEHFDVIVVGQDLAPLLCAALLCKRGFRVLVVGGGPARSGHVPAVTGQLASPVARRILSELGITQIVHRKEEPVDPLLQIVTPRARISVHSEPERLLSEFTRELPAEREGARIFYERLPAALASIDEVLGAGLPVPAPGLIDRQRLKRMMSATEFGFDGLGSRLLSSLSTSPGVRSCVFTHVVPLSRLDRRQIAPVHAALIHGRAVSHQVALAGGLHGLCALLVDRISTSRGEAKLGDRVEYVEVERGRVVHVKLVGHESATGCDTLVCGIPAAGMARILRSDGRRLDDDPLGEKGPVPVAHLATMRLVLRDDVFPEPVARLVHVQFDEAAPPFEHNVAFMERGPAAVDGASTLDVSFLLDHVRLLDERDYARDVADRLRACLRRVVPFLDDFLEGIEYPSPDASSLSAEEHPEEVLASGMPAVYRTADPGPWGACGRRYETGLKNLLLCSGEVLPGFGDEGAWLTAWSAAGLVTGRDPGKTRFGSRSRRWSF